MTRTNLDVIRATYEGPSEENGRHLLAALAPQATWTEAAGFLYAGTYTGPQAIFDNVVPPVVYRGHCEKCFGSGQVIDARM